MPVICSHQNVSLLLAKSDFWAPNAGGVEDFHIGEGSGLWFSLAVRGDVNFIRNGERTNLQDGTIVHVTGKAYLTRFGDDVSDDHGVKLHGCTVQDSCLVGIGAIVLGWAETGLSSIVAAGTVLAPGTKNHPHSLVMGQPGRVIRTLTKDECENIRYAAYSYLVYQDDYCKQVESIG